MDLKNIRKIYFDYILRFGEYTEDMLDECLRLHLYQEVKKLGKIDKKILELEGLVGNSRIYCPKNHKDITLCSYDDIFTSYVKTVIFDFLKNGELQNGTI